MLLTKSLQLFHCFSSSILQHPSKYYILILFYLFVLFRKESVWETINCFFYCHCRSSSIIDPFFSLYFFFCYWKSLSYQFFVINYLFFIFIQYFSFSFLWYFVYIYEFVYSSLKLTAILILFYCNFMNMLNAGLWVDFCWVVCIVNLKRKMLKSGKYVVGW